MREAQQQNLSGVESATTTSSATSSSSSSSSSSSLFRPATSVEAPAPALPPRPALPTARDAQVPAILRRL